MLIKGNISYFIAQQEVVDNAIDPALSKTVEVESLNQGSSFSPRESVSTTTTPVHPRIPKKWGKGQRIMLTISEKPSMATFAERISNEVSEFIAETGASKRAHLPKDPQVLIPNPVIQSASLSARVPDEFQTYCKALALLMEMYKEAKFSADEVTDTIDLLESTPIRCVTFVGLTEDLRQGWLKKAIRAKAQQISLFN